MTVSVTYGDEVVLTIDCKDGQYHLDAGGEHDDPWPEPDFAATTGEDSWFAVICGTDWGPVDVRFQLVHDLAEVPQSQLLDAQWEMITERDIEVGVIPIEIIEMYTPQPYNRIETGAGLFRIRLHMANRMEARDSSDLTSPVERHWVLIWPTPEPAPPSLLRGPDTYAESY